MNCSEAKRRLSAHLDRDLTFEEEERLRIHLSACDGCRDEEEQLQCLLGLLHNLPEVDPGEGFFAAVQARIAEAEAGKRDAAYEPQRESLSFGEWLRESISSVWLRPALGAACGLALGLFIGFSGVFGLNGDVPQQGAGIAQNAGDPAAEPGIEISSGGVGPLADIELPDSSDPDGVHEEYILDPYRLDPDNGLVPQGSVEQRMVQGDRDSQSDVVITF